MSDASLDAFLKEYGADSLSGENWTLELPDGADSVRAFFARHFNGTTPESFMDRLAARLPGTMKTTLYIRPDGTGSFSFGVYGTGGVLYARGERTFNVGEGVVEHEELSVNERFRGRGLGARLLANAVTAYRAAGFKQIECGAGRENGGYTWARLGFIASRPGWEQLRSHVLPRVRQLEDRLPAPVRQTLNRIMASDDPKALWLLADLDHKIDGVKLGRRLLTGNAWPARFDLNEPAQINRLAAALKRPPTGPATQPAPDAPQHSI